MDPIKVLLELKPAGAYCKVSIDGVEVKHCRAIKVDADVKRATTVTLELINVDVTVVGEAAHVVRADVPAEIVRRTLANDATIVQTDGLDAHNHTYAVVKD